MSAPVPEQAIVLAAGEGRRLRPLTERLPKPLVPFVGAPLLEHALRRLARAGVRRVALNGHHRGDVLAAWVARRPVPELELTLVQEPELLGTGGGIAGLARRLDPGPLLVLAGDVVADFDLADLATRHAAVGGVASMGLTACGDPEHFGPVGVDARGHVVDIVRRLGRPSAALYVNASVHLLEAEFVRRLPHAPSCLVRDGYLPALAEGALVAGWLHDGPWAETGTPEGLLAAQAAALSGALPVDAALLARGGRHQPGEALVHPSARVAPDARLTGGTVVGPRAEVGAGARLTRCFVQADARVPAGARHEGQLLLHHEDHVAVPTPPSPFATHDERAS